MKTEIIPSLLVYSLQELEARLQAIGVLAPVAQFDVLDGTLVPYQNFCDPEFVNGLSLKIPLEVHLMVEDALSHIEKWNYSWVKKIIFHLEAGIEPKTALARIKALGKQAGIAISPQTPASAALPFVGNVDTILVMTVEPGRNGAPFLPQTLDKVRALREKAPNLNLEVDGGINFKTIKDCLKAGANLFVVGSFLKNKEFIGRYQQLREVVE